MCRDSIADIVVYNRLEKSSEAFKARNQRLRLLEEGLYESKADLLWQRVLEEQKAVLAGYEPLVLSEYVVSERGVCFADTQSFLCGFRTYTSQEYFGYVYRGVWRMNCVGGDRDLPGLLRLNRD